MKTQDLELTIAAFLANQQNLLILGGPGMGKTCVVQAGIVRAGLTYCTINGAICDPLDSKGALWVNPETKQAFYVPIGILNDILDGKIDVVFLDEITTSPLSMQNGFAQWVQARMIGDRKIPDNVRFIAAGNRPEDRCGVQQVSAMLTDRFTSVTVEADHKSWVAWATLNDIDPVVVSFVARKNGEGFCDQGAPKVFCEAVPTARGYERVHHIRQMGLPAAAERECIVGAIGEGMATEFNGHVAVCNELPDFNLILDDPENVDVPEASNVLFALSNALLRAVLDDDPRAGAAFRFAERMCEAGELEIATFLVQTIEQVDQLTNANTGKHPRHNQGKEFISLVNNHLKHMMHGD